MDYHFCPHCRHNLTLVSEEHAQWKCGACQRDWWHYRNKLNPTPLTHCEHTLRRFLLYTLSLPERAIRSGVGVAAGAARETAGLLVPQAFQNSKVYEIAVRKSLKFLAEDIGGVKSGTGNKEDGESEYLARKVVGNFVELAGMATLHVSPLWLLAIVSDVAYGSKVYLRELAVELQKQGLIAESSVIHNVDDVLDAIQNSSGSAATLFDSPPLSVEELKRTLDNTRAGIASLDYHKILPEAELAAHWEEMRQIALQEKVSLLGLSGAMTMHSLNKLRTVGDGALTGLRVAGGLFNKHVLGHYAESLERIRHKGMAETLHETSTPYIEAVWQNFSSEQETVTEGVVSGRLFSRVWNWLTTRKTQTPPSPAPGPDLVELPGE